MILSFHKFAKVLISQIILNPACVFLVKLIAPQTIRGILGLLSMLATYFDLYYI